MKDFNIRKSRDLAQAFDRLISKINEFNEEPTANRMERSEIEGVIQQANRLHDKLEKFIKIYSRHIG